MSLTKTDLKKFLSDIRAADKTQVEAQFHIANILCAIKDHELYEMGGYSDFKMMVRAELSFAHTCAEKYVSLHRQYTKYKYSKEEFLRLLQQFDWRRVEEALRENKKKMGYRAMTNWMAARSEGSSDQFNFNVTDKHVAAKLESILSRFGMEVPNSGRRSHLTTAFLLMMEDYERLQLAERSTDLTGTKKQQLKAVA